MSVIQTGKDNSNNIKRKIYCSLCVNDWLDKREELGDLDLIEYQHLTLGATESGVQVWCNKHDVNIIEIDIFDKSAMEGYCSPKHVHLTWLDKVEREGREYVGEDE